MHPISFIIASQESGFIDTQMVEMQPHQPEEEEAPAAPAASPKTQPPVQLSASSDSEADSPPSSPSSKSKQLVIYDPQANGAVAARTDIQPISMFPPVGSGSGSMPRRRPGFTSSSQTLPSVGAFTVQCAGCFKWRLIPTKEKYEEIREHILENPFFCETAREWRPDVSCDDPPDISPDGSRLWAIDKPNIAVPPPGWQRLLRIRGEGSTKFADVYYVAPSGKRFRSMVEVQKYLIEHPEYIRSGVTMAQFSFIIPKPLQENYVRKKRRPARLNDSFDHASKAKPISCAVLDDRLTLRLPPPSFEDDDPLGEPPQKQMRYSGQSHSHLL